MKIKRIQESTPYRQNDEALENWKRERRGVKPLPFRGEVKHERIITRSEARFAETFTDVLCMVVIGLIMWALLSN